ncbi:cation:proton antiporter regulatory subunit [Alkalimarinus alittae]
MSKGYGVSELYIPEGAKLVGMAIKDTDLSEKDINVLTLYRGSKVIPNPKPTRELEANDKLLCFGKLESMRSMVPAKTRRRRQPEVTDLPDSILGETATERLEKDADK